MAGVGQCSFSMADLRFAVRLGPTAVPAPAVCSAGRAARGAGTGRARFVRGMGVGLGLGEAG